MNETGPSASVARRLGSVLRRTPSSEGPVASALWACAFVSIATTVAIIAILSYETFAFAREVSLLRLFTDVQWTPLFVDKHFGIWPLLAGTMLTTAIAMAVALPLGLLSAIYMAEFAAPRTRRFLKPTLELLAGVPTIVYGYFALVVLTPVLQRIVPDLAGFNALSPGLVMGVMIVPMISSLSEDALSSVPNALKEGAYALGATRLVTLFKVSLPSASSGLVAAIILALSRAVGETMIVAIAAGQQPRLTLDPRVPVETMTAYIVQVGLGDVPTGTLEYVTIFVVGAALFGITFAFNLISRRFARKYRRGDQRD